VPVRTILATIGLLLVTALLLYILVETRRVITWMIIGAFFAVALYPVVDWVQRRMFSAGGERWPRCSSSSSSSWCWALSSPPSSSRWARRQSTSRTRPPG
jgi:predicted PurR-regulated permease PerM